MKKLILLSSILLAACGSNRVTSYVEAQDINATCEESKLLANAQRVVDAKPGENVDAAFCKSRGYLFACHAVYADDKGVECAPIMDVRTDEQKKAAADKAAGEARAAHPVPPPLPAPAPTPDAGSGSGSAK